MNDNESSSAASESNRKYRIDGDSESIDLNSTAPNFEVEKGQEYGGSAYVRNKSWLLLKVRSDVT